MAKDCIEPNIPTVDNEACECQNGIHSSNCINLAEVNSYLNLPAGTSLTKVIDRISKKMKSNAKKAEAVQRDYKVVELEVSQQGTSTPIVSVIKKEITGPIIPIYVAPGYYRISMFQQLVGAVRVFVGSFDNQYGEEVKAYKDSDSLVKIRTGTDNNFNTNGVLNKTPIRIEIPN